MTTVMKITASNHDAAAKLLNHIEARMLAQNPHPFYLARDAYAPGGAIPITIASTVSVADLSLADFNLLERLRRSIETMSNSEEYHIVWYVASPSARDRSFRMAAIAITPNRKAGERVFRLLVDTLKTIDYRFGIRDNCGRTYVDVFKRSDLIFQISEITSVLKSVDDDVMTVVDAVDIENGSLVCAAWKFDDTDSLQTATSIINDLVIAESDTLHVLVNMKATTLKIFSTEKREEWIKSPFFVTPRDGSGLCDILSAFSQTLQLGDDKILQQIPVKLEIDGGRFRVISQTHGLRGPFVDQAALALWRLADTVGAKITYELGDSACGTPFMQCRVKKLDLSIWPTATHEIAKMITYATDFARLVKLAESLMLQVTVTNVVISGDLQVGIRATRERCSGVDLMQACEIYQILDQYNRHVAYSRELEEMPLS